MEIHLSEIFINQSQVVCAASLTLRTLLYGNDDLECEENSIIITETLRFIKDTNMFD